jgi:Acyclic terpene utilisation family protein AtuA
MAGKTITIGGASGYWGDASLGTQQLLATGQLDYLVYDYLAEITMSIMARARAADESRGYATDFVSSAMKPSLGEISRQGIKVIANAGGVNPRACAEALRELIEEQGLALKVGVVHGDDLTSRAEQFRAAGVTEMFSGELFPEPEKLASMNAYLGAFPIARALEMGADIVVTGRCVDSAVTLAAGIHSFGWQHDNYDQLAQGSLAGHILECGTQATGGNFTDWEAVAHSLCDAGYPMVEMDETGNFDVLKPADTGGVVSVGSVAEQMLYEIGDPQAYILPDVVCDFSNVQVDQAGEGRVRVSGARGLGAPQHYKVSATWADGYRAGHIWTMYGRDADIKALTFADTVLQRANRALAAVGLEPLSETCIEIIGAESHFGAAARPGQVREVDVKIAAKHTQARGIAIFLKEMSGMALAAPPGLCGFAGARAKPSPVVRLFSLLLSKQAVDIQVEVEGEVVDLADTVAGPHNSPSPQDLPAAGDEDPGAMVTVPLEALAWARSGDKGNKANIGVIARKAEYLPYIAAALNPGTVAQYFAHFLEPGSADPVECFYLPGVHALNFLLHDVLGGGGVASLRSDAQGKGFAQLLLQEQVLIPGRLFD